MKNIWTKFWPYIVTLALWVVAIVLVANCSRSLKKENEQLREEIARQQQYVPLQRDTIRDTVELITQQVVEVEKVKEVLSSEDKELLKDLNTKVSAIESFQKIGMATEAEVTLQADTTPKSKEGTDSLFSYKDAWLDLKYNSNNNNLSILLHDSLAIVVKKEYKKKFLWWRWGCKGYEVKAVNFNPYSTIRYNTYVKKKR